MLLRNKLLVAALALAVIASFAFSAYTQAQKPAKAPALVIASRTIDLGDVIEGHDAQYTFVVKNEGEAELQILSVRPG